MLMSVAEIARNVGLYPELAGARVLVTGIQSTRGVDLVRAFGEHGCRMVLQVPEISSEIDAILSHVAETALEIHVHHDPIDTAEEAVRFTQATSRHFGGFDIVVNLIPLDLSDLRGIATPDDIETMIADRFQSAARTTGVAANRMGLTWTHGSVLNILCVPATTRPEDQVIIAMARTTLAAMTRGEADRWQGHGVRINAVAPMSSLVPNLLSDADLVRSEPDAAALALYLASAEAESLSGLIFDADQSASNY
jgi:NAD(P)-dependent dehydrogenase (short-subunit alcohol dehydrogenase family)